MGNESSVESVKRDEYAVTWDISCSPSIESKHAVLHSAVGGAVDYSD